MKCKLDEEECTSAIASKRKCNFIQACYADIHRCMIYFYFTSWFYPSIVDCHFVYVSLDFHTEHRGMCVTFSTRGFIACTIPYVIVDILHRNRLKWMNEWMNAHTNVYKCDLHFQFYAKPSKNNQVNLQKRSHLVWYGMSNCRARSFCYV